MLARSSFLQYVWVGRIFAPVGYDPYGVVLHPRYLAVLFGNGGFALVVKYLGVYLVLLVSVLVLSLVVPLGERELMEREFMERFGEEYRSYRVRVPALIPKVRRKASDQQGV